MPKYTRFANIPRFTESGAWECDFQLNRVIAFVDEQTREAGLDLDPDFQRGHVWTVAQQSRWIEFFLRGGTTGRVLYFNNPAWSGKASSYTDFVIVDGKQRLEAIRAFVGGRLKVFGSYHHEYTDEIRLTQTMKINVNDLKTRAEVLLWYLQMNSGGTVHTDEELARIEELLKSERKSRPLKKRS